MRKSIILFLLAFLVFPSALLAQDRLKLQEGAPDRYVVEKGDTLWGIAGKFLKDPWRWPEIWRLNEDQLKNPHRIYPGDVIVLDRGMNPPELTTAAGSVKLVPQIRAESLTEAAIPAIPARFIEPFLSRPLVIEEGGLANAPRLVGTREERVNLGAGSTAYVTGMGESRDQNWHLFRQGRPLIDPDSAHVLGYEAIFLGTAHVVKFGDPATVTLVTTTQEVSPGDRLLPAGTPVINEYAPHPPKIKITARVIGVLGALPNSDGAKNSVVSLSKGSNSGLEMGHVLALMRAGGTIPDPQSTLSPDRAPRFQLPDERYGLAFVFRVFNGVSYALIMDSLGPVTPGDFAQTP